MVEKATLSITYEEEGYSDQEIGVRLEVDPWEPYNGVITNTSLVNALLDVAFKDASDSLDDISNALTSIRSMNGYVPLQINCGKGADGIITVDVYAYPSPSDLRYSIRTVRGVLQGRVTEDVDFNEVVHVELQSPTEGISPEYPVHKIVSYDWLGNVYDFNGVVTQKPRIDVVDGKFFIPEKVYGSLDIVYTVKRTKHTLSIIDSDLLDDLSQYTFVYAIWDGGASYVAIDKTRGDEDSQSMCSDDWGNDGNVNDPDPEGYVKPRDRKQEYNYCSGALTKDTTN